jgi:hypothetical protein
MRFCNSIFATLLKPLDRRRFKAIVARHDGDAYDKSFHSWDHLLALIFAQLSGLDSLRGVAAGWNANAHHHYHLGSATLTRTTLADANARRPVGVFADTFAMLARVADRKTRRDGNQMLRLIDSSPIPLGKLCGFATWNGRIRGLKMHAVYDPLGDRPTRVEVTLATVNDSLIGRKTPIEPGATSACAGAGSMFSTRATAITDGGPRSMTPAPGSSPGPSATPNSGSANSARSTSSRGTAFAFSRTARSPSTARATARWRCRCAASKSSARTPRRSSS